MLFHNTQTVCKKHAYNVQAESKKYARKGALLKDVFFQFTWNLQSALEHSSPLRQSLASCLTS